MSRPLLIFAFLYCILIILFEQFNYFLYPPKNNPANYLSENEATLTGKIVSSPERKGQRISFLLSAEKIIFSDSSNIVVKGKVLVYSPWEETDFSFPYTYGDKIQITGLLKLPQSAVNPGSFDYRKYLVRKEIYLILYVNSLEKIKKISSGNRYSFFYWTNWTREKFSQIIEKKLPEEEASILSALLLGQKSLLEPELKKIFIDAGVMHVLVVSGLHVGFIIAIFYWLFRWLFHLSRRISYFLLIPTIFFYLFLTGASVPTVRASIMAISFILALLLRRETHIYQAFLLAGLIILIFNPQSLFDAGAQLSFVATLGIVYLLPNFLKIPLPKSKIPNYLGILFFTTFSAQLAVNPLIAYYFHKVSLIAFLSNLVVVPLIGIILATGFLFIFSSFLGGIVLFLLKQLNLVLVTSLIKIVDFFASLPKAIINVPQPSWLFFFWYYFSLITVFKVNPVRDLVLKDKTFSNGVKKSSFWRNFFLGGQIFCLTIFLSHHYLTNNQLQITFLSVGQGDAIFLELPNRTNLLIDAGGSNYEPGERITAPFLCSRGIWQIDRVILTHPDYFHYSGMKTILEKFRVKEFITNPEYSTEENYLEIREIIKKKKINFKELWAGETINFGNGEIKFFNPKILTENKDDNLLAFQLKYKNFRIFFPSDLTPEGQKKLSQEEIRSDVLLIPAHGLKPVNEEFFKQVSAKYGIISTQRPAGGILPQRIKIYSTHEHGAITLLTDGKKIKIQPYLK